MKKKSLFIIVVLLFSINVISAKEVYYINENNVSFTEEEYDFISDVFYEGYQRLMSNVDYQKIFVDTEIINSDIISKTFIWYDSPAQRNTFYETASKEMTISKVCASSCYMFLEVVWKNSPKVRSYDVIGAYLDGVDLINTPETKVDNLSMTNRSEEIVTQTNGFGTSIKLLSSGTDMIITQYYSVSKGGTVYASYQHATSSISLTNSKKYTISRSGYGGVFLFNSSVSNYYDAMGGVDISV